MSEDELLSALKLLQAVERQYIKDDIINGNIDLTNVVSGDKNDLIVSDDNTLFQITSSDNQNYNEYKDIRIAAIASAGTGSVKNLAVSKE